MSSKGLVHYHKREFAEAKMHFEEVVRHNLKDKSARFYLRRVTHFMKYGAPPDWEGIEVLTYISSILSLLRLEQLAHRATYSLCDVQF